jgi:nitroreductase
MDILTDTEKQAQPEAKSATPVEQKPGQEQRSPAEEKLRVESRARSGANWFFWIAALSLINSIATMAGSDWGFIIGLGITQVFDAIGAEFGARAVTFVLSVLAAGVFVLFGVFAHKQHSWSYIVGMVLYALDGLLFLAVGDILSVGFHVFVLFWMFNGYRANKALAGHRA